MIPLYIPIEIISEIQQLQDVQRALAGSTSPKVLVLWDKLDYRIKILQSKAVDEIISAMK